MDSSNKVLVLISNGIGHLCSSAKLCRQDLLCSSVIGQSAAKKNEPNLQRYCRNLNKPTRNYQKPKKKLKTCIRTSSWKPFGLGINIIPIYHYS
jgi:hypothetical protein